jgi:enoyl-CoA hydratase/carnithine racemase
MTYDNSLPTIILDIDVVRIPQFHSFLDKDGHAFAISLIDRIQSRSASKHIGLSPLILFQEKRDVDYRSWSAELKGDLFHVDLLKRLETFRRLLSLVRRTNLPLFFVFQGNCFDTLWEFALACRMVLALDTAALVGFKEISAGFFPPGGTVEYFFRRRMWAKEKWTILPVMTCEQALDEELVFLVANTSNPVDATIEWMRTNWEFIANCLDDMKQSRQDSAEDLPSKAESVIGGAVVHESGMIPTISRSTEWGWDSCWQSLESRNKYENSRKKESKLLNLIANQYFSDRYLAFLQNCKTTVYSGFTGATTPAKITIFIDVNDGLPPIKIIFRLLSQNVGLHFVGGDSKVLIGFLEKIFSRLERHSSSEIARDLWERNIFWHAGSRVGNSAITLQWTHDDFFSIASDGVKTPFYRPCGNNYDAEVGPCEMVQQDLPSQPNSLQILSLVADSVVRSAGVTELGIPISVWLRSKALEEILRLSVLFGKDVDSILKSLGDLGWKSTSEEASWSTFLYTRYTRWSGLDTSDRFIQRFGPSRQSWNLPGWKQAKQSVTRPQGKLLPWNPTAVSWHLGVFSGVLAHVLVDHGLLTDLAVADSLCAAAVGFPSSWEPPSEFLGNQNVRRIQRLINGHWREMARSEGS